MQRLRSPCAAPVLSHNLMHGHGFDIVPAEKSRFDGSCAAEKRTASLGVDCLLDGPQRVVTISALLKRVGNAQSLLTGRLVHHHVVECGYGWEKLLGNCLMHMYGHCGHVDEAQATFDRLRDPDTYSWNILIDLYGRNCGLNHARRVFGMMPSPNVVSWNAILTLLVMNDRHELALNSIFRMQIESILPNDVTLICAIDACSAFGSIKRGMQLHVQTIIAGYQCRTIVGTALVNMYASCKDLYHARCVFSTLTSQDTVSWTAMMGGLKENGCNEDALAIFHNMQSQGVCPNHITFICAMEACANIGLLEEGMEIHTSVVIMGYNHEIKVENALIDMYSKCGSLWFALRTFGGMQQQTIVTWNAVILAFGQHGFAATALSLFTKMQTTGVKPDTITFIAAMSSCSHMGLIEEGLCLFLYMDYEGYVHEADHYVCMIDLLGRAGRLDEAEQVVIKSPPGIGLVAWLCLLAACKLHGDADKGSYAADCCFKLDESHSAPYIVLSNLYTDLGLSYLQNL